MSTARKRPSAATRLAGVAYDVYTQLRDTPENDRLRMAYHDGVLEIMSPEFGHEKGSRRLAHLVYAYCKTYGVVYEEAGSTTFRKGLPGRLEGSGREPDASFHLGAAARAVVGKESLDLAIDPPPSLWIETDNRGATASKLPLYAALGVPEVWRYRPRQRTLWFGRLSGSAYEPLTTSAALPGLTPALVLDLLDPARSQPLSNWADWLRDTWFPAHRAELLGEGEGEDEGEGEGEGEGGDAGAARFDD